jgi:transketolase
MCPVVSQTQTTIQTNLKHLYALANEARGLALDAVNGAKSGHLGMPLGCAELGVVLFGHVLNFYPKDPRWENRDRLVLSAGHGSLFLYTWLHLAGFDLSLNDLKRFRQWGSRTPGHPEFGLTPGVECTTGPLGQGIGNAVGMAIAAKHKAAKFNRDGHVILDYKIVCIFGDGCFQEGIAGESFALAAHWKLDNLIFIYDANGVTLDAPLQKTQSENILKRFEVYDFDVQVVDGHDVEAIEEACLEAKENRDGKPHVIILKTTIGKGIEAVAGTPKAHGESGIAFVKEAKKALGLPIDGSFFVSEETRRFFRQRNDLLATTYQTWREKFQLWEECFPELAEELRVGWRKSVESVSPEAFFNEIPVFDAGKPIATRTAAGKILQFVAKNYPSFVTGSADLFSSTKNYLEGVGDFSQDNPLGRNFFFGIREHAMGAILNGLAYDGFLRPSGATFLVFSDYMRGAIRLAAIAHLPVIYLFTHDSILIGEDGPTHQPVETIDALRCIPSLTVVRPADAEETVGAIYAALTRTDGPTALILTRQEVSSLQTVDAQQRRAGVLRGGYVVKQEIGSLEGILMASGSEVALAIEAAQFLGKGVRVVSIPSFELFESQELAYRESILPPACKKRLSIEAGTSRLWRKYVGDQGHSVAVNTFGYSAPEGALREHFGLTVENVVKVFEGLR